MFTETFDYTITDSAFLGALSDTATVSITVTGTNADPIAVNDAISVDQNALLNQYVTPAVVGQDNDPDGDAITVSAVNGGCIGGIINLASGAQVTMAASGVFSYDQNSAFAGLAVGATASDSFQYTITDGNGGFDTATATVTINGDNDQPIAVDDVFSVSANAVLNQDVTPGTIGQDSDPDGDAFSVTAVNGGGIGGVINLGSGASATMNATGSFSYNQNGAFAGLVPGASANYSFQHTISDGNGGTDTATAFITVNGIDNPPIVTNIGADLLVGCQTLLSFNLLNAKDPEGSSRNQLTYTVESAPISGDAFLQFGQVLQARDTFTQADIHGGLVEFRHNDGGPAGAFDLGLTVTDKTGATTAPFTFTVNVKTPDEFQISTNGQYKLFGGNGDSALTGLGGNDGLFGHGGDDCLRGGDGNDGLFAHGGDDVIHGGAGNNGDDRLFGGDGDDMVWGNNGVDVMSGGNGNDEMAGGAGDDIIYGK
jgi:VCBS repeat-containing protein